MGIVDIYLRPSNEIFVFHCKIGHKYVNKMFPQASLTTIYICDYETVLATRIQSEFVHETAVPENKNTSQHFVVVKTSFLSAYLTLNPLTWKIW